MNKIVYDVLVIGGGPAGSVTAERCAKGNLKTLILERDKEIGQPVRCAEGIMTKSLGDLGEIPESLVSTEIRKVKLVPPDNNEIEIHNSPDGLILNRNLFDKYLAERALEAGAYIKLQANVTNAEYDQTSQLFSIEIDASKSSIYSKVLVAADGVDGRVAKWFGIDNKLNLEDIDSCAQYLVNDKSLTDGECKFIFNADWAPGGYVWVFPKGKNKANIGLGVNPERTDKTAKQHLDEYMQAQYPQAKMLRFTCGAVPVKETIKTLVKDRVLLVGDCAHQTNAISGGGIDTAIEAGKLCGDAIVSAFSDKGISDKKLKSYQTKWFKKNSNKEKIEELIKQRIIKANNDKLNKYFDFIREIPLDKLSFHGIFKEIILKKPKLFAKLTTKMFFDFMK